MNQVELMPYAKGGKLNESRGMEREYYYMIRVLNVLYNVEWLVRYMSPPVEQNNSNWTHNSTQIKRSHDKIGYP